MSSEISPARRVLVWAALLFSGLTFLVSWWHWWTFQYGTFDLAFYVQALWLALRGKWMVSLLNVPLMGNHAEPIVFLLTPLFAICPHPMMFVAVQTLAFATMPFTAWRIGRGLGLAPEAALCLALATLVTPGDFFHRDLRISSGGAGRATAAAAHRGAAGRALWTVLAVVRRGAGGEGKHGAAACHVLRGLRGARMEARSADGRSRGTFCPRCSPSGGCSFMARSSARRSMRAMSIICSFTASSALRRATSSANSLRNRIASSARCARRSRRATCCRRCCCLFSRCRSCARAGS